MSAAALQVAGAVSGPVSAVPPKRRLPAGSVISYGIGAAAYGVKDSGFGTFLLLFYNQTIGLPPGQVGLVVMVALLVDAFIDPAVGFFSDRTRGRWGRRHPWMYASALPIAVGWLLLWNPPHWSQGATLGWLFVTAVLVRSAVSAFEVPAAALTPELSADYDERTRITAWRYLFGWAGGLLMLIAAYTIFLAPNPALATRGDFAAMALLGAVAMVVTILISALGTHREIPYLPKPAIERRTLRESFRDMGETLRNKPFLILIAAGIAAYTNQGISYALSNYLYAFVWGIKGFTFVYLTLGLFAGVIVAFVIAPRLGRMGSKKVLSAAFLAGGATLSMTPYLLRLLGVFPTVGSPLLVPSLMGFYALANIGTVTGLILAASMAADVTEDSEAQTGRRSEGVFSAGWFFVQKCTSGIGIFLAGVILSFAGFPAAARPGQVPAATIDRLTIIYAGSYWLIAMLAALVLLRFPFGRNEHDARLAKLAAKTAAEATPHQV